jgi:three-Cys-motif partner protein
MQISAFTEQPYPKLFDSFPVELLINPLVMPGKNLHKEPFDDGTLLKLEIFHKYLKEWLPVFLNWKYGPIQINIVDFFAGQGKDINGTPGSPLLIIQTVLKHIPEIISKKLQLRIILNELDKDKYNLLKVETDPFLNKPFELIVENKPFYESFNAHAEKFANAANFIFLDQNGIKEITEGIFQKLIAFQRTDILFFISSSYLYRFKSLNEFKKYLNTHKINFDESNYHSCHRAVLNFYKEQVKGHKEYYLGPFSLKKGSNIYGLIFGSNHTYGIEKFLKICWNLDPQRGEANYDIDSDKINPATPSLFAQFDVPKKVQVFETEIQQYLLRKPVHSLGDIYRMALDKGFQPKHVNKILKDLKSKGRINFNCTLMNVKIHLVSPTITITNCLWRNHA